MKIINTYSSTTILIFLIIFLTQLNITNTLAKTKQDASILPSWREGTAKNSILEFITSTTSPENKAFIEEGSRIAVFRHDGVLIAEKPELQKAFLAKALKKLSKENPSLLNEEPLKASAGDITQYLENLSSDQLTELGEFVRKKAGSHENYQKLINVFLTTAKNPTFDSLYKELKYQPVMELLSYLRAVGFDVYIVASGDVEFIKNISNTLYGIPSNRVLNIEQLPSIFVNQRPILTIGRLDHGEDLKMMEFSRNSPLPNMQVMIEHDDEVRDIKYGQKNEKALKDIAQYGYIHTRVKSDWKSVFPKIIDEEPIREDSKVLPKETTTALEGKPQIGITRPLKEKGPTPVSVGIFIVDIDEIETVSQNFTANIFYRFQWWDPRLAHGGQGVVYYKITDIWFPPALLVNRQKIWQSLPQLVQVSGSGEVIYEQRIWGHFSQPLNLHNFPFDSQTLEISFVTPKVSPEEIKFLLAEPGGFGTAKNFSVPDWKMLGWKYHTKPFIPREEVKLAAITFSIEMERQSSHYIYKIIIPLVLIVIMSWIVFWIDPKQIGTNVAASTTAFLTLIAYRFVIGSLLPKISYFTRLDKFVLYSTILVFLGVLQTILMSHLTHKNKYGLTVTIEQWSRVIYPLGFVGVILVTLVL